MTAKDCFKGKIRTGRVSQRAANRIMATLRDAETRAAAGDAGAVRAAHEETAKIAAADFAKKVAVATGNIRAQADVLRAQKAYGDELAALDKAGRAPVTMKGLRGRLKALAAAMNSLMVRDPHEIATWDNVYYLGQTLRKESLARFADAIEYLRPKKLGLAAETARENDVLDALHGGPASAESAAVARSWTEEAERARVLFNQAAGFEAIPKRADWRIGNPHMDAAKVQAWTREAFAARVAPLLDRARMIDFRTGAPLTEARLQEVLFDVHETARLDGATGDPSAGYVGAGPLSARRSAQRVLMLKDADAWRAFNELFGSGAGVFETMTRHLAAMAHDTAMMRVLGPDPQATRRFVLSLFDREAARLSQQGDPADTKSMAAAVRANEKAAAAVKRGRNSFETHWAHMTGEASIPVDAELAVRLGDARAFLASAQLGGALLSSFADLGSLMATARVNGLPVVGTLQRALAAIGDPQSEITAAQAGVIADSLAHAAHMTDRYMGETIRASTAAKLSGAVMRASGLRRWSSVLRSSFGLEMMAQMATHAERRTAFEALPFRAALERYGVSREMWDEAARHARDNGYFEPRPGARFLRPMDLPQESRARPALARMIQTEIDFTAIEGDPLTRAVLFGQARPGSGTGEIRRAFGMYKSFPVTILLTHGARALARGWDGSRLQHAAFTFLAMSLFGMLSYQTKEMVSGRDPVTMDPTQKAGQRAWLNAVLQGGGLGPFGDIVTQDKTRYGNSWAAFLGGPLLSAAEDVAGQWALKNIQLAAQGRETHFLGDAVWIGARYLPGSSLWYARAAFQRAVSDQLLLLADDRAQERFARIEARARENYDQEFWWRRGEPSPRRAPGLSAAFGGAQ